MSYIEYVSKIFEELLRGFEEKYPDGNNEIKTEEDLHSNADSFVNSKTFVESYNDVIDFIRDYNIRDQAEIKMHVNDYSNFVNLFNDAVQYEAWEYLINNYVVGEIEEEEEEEV